MIASKNAFNEKDLEKNENFYEEDQFIETDKENKEFIIIAKIPGFDKEDINVYSNPGGLFVQAEKKSNIKEEDKINEKYCEEQRQMAIYEFVPLPDEADKDNVDISYDGITLELRIAKRK